MRIQLATRILLMIVGVLAVTLTSSVIALWSSWRVEGVLQSVVAESRARLQAAEELEIALLDQRGYVSAYMLDDGDDAWLKELRAVEPAFARWLDAAKQTASSQAEKQILESLDAEYAVYDAQRDQAIALYDAGDHERARRVLLDDVYQSYRRAYDLCEGFIAANEQAIAAVTAGARREVQLATLTVGMLVAATFALGGALLWLFFARVLFPLRRMLGEVRQFSEAADPRLEPQDELRAVGAYLQTLMTDMADTRQALRQSRVQLEQGQKLASVGKLAASVAHEIRNPLTAVKMWLFSLRKTAGGDAAVQRKFEMISDELARLESVVQSFLEFSRPPDLRLQRVDVSRLLESTVELLSHRLEERQVRVEFSPMGSLPDIEGDPEQLKQVLINLIWNAVEAMERGGVVHISALEQAEASGKPAVVVRVCDSGSGIPEEVKHQIYEPFFTTKEGGAGLGLCIAASILARHGGRLVIESSTPQGTCFAMRLLVHPETIR